VLAERAARARARGALICQGRPPQRERPGPGASLLSQSPGLVAYEASAWHCVGAAGLAAAFGAHPSRDKGGSTSQAARERLSAAPPGRRSRSSSPRPRCPGPLLAFEPHPVSAALAFVSRAAWPSRSGARRTRGEPRGAGGRARLRAAVDVPAPHGPHAEVEADAQRPGEEGRDQADVLLVDGHAHERGDQPGARRRGARARAGERRRFGDARQSRPARRAGEERPPGTRPVLV
jgi:hypothetical protein